MKKKKKCLYTGKKYYKPKYSIWEETQLYTKLSSREKEILNKVISEKSRYTKAIWLRRAILRQLRLDLMG